MTDGKHSLDSDRGFESDPWDPFGSASESGGPDGAVSKPDEDLVPDRDDPSMLDATGSDAAEDVETYGLSVAEPVRATGLDSSPPPSVDAAGSGPPVIGERPQRVARRRRRKRRRSPDALQTRPVPDWPLRSALWYPFEGAGLAVLMLYAVLLAISRLVPLLGPILAVFVLTYMALLFLETASYTLEDIPGGLRFPSLDLADVQAGLYGMTVMLIGMAPYVFLRVLISRLGGESPVWELTLWPLPMYYLPMAYLVLADLEHERGLDPRRVVRAIRQVGSTYFVLVTIAAAVFLVPAVTLTLLELPPPILEPINAFLMMSAMVALLRATGLLYLRSGVTADLPDDAARQSAEAEPEQAKPDGV